MRNCSGGCSCLAVLRLAGAPASEPQSREGDERDRGRCPGHKAEAAGYRIDVLPAPQLPGSLANPLKQKLAPDLPNRLNRTVARSTTTAHRTHARDEQCLWL